MKSNIKNIRTKVDKRQIIQYLLLRQRILGNKIVYPTTNSKESIEIVKIREKEIGKLDDTMQERFVRACACPQSIDELAVQLKLSLAELQTHLFDLQIAGLIEQDFTGMWKLV